MNCLCDLTQFFIYIDITTCPSSTDLAKMFIKHVIMTFDMVAVIVVDANSLFLKDFEKMCTILCIHFWQLSQGNHKGNSSERFLNKNQAIRGNDRGTHKYFLENAKTTQFAWNSVQSITLISLGLFLPLVENSSFH